jgi:hypothetical protein
MKNEHGEYEYRTTITIMDVEIDVDLLMVDDFSMRDTITITLDNEQTALLQEAIEIDCENTGTDIKMAEPTHRAIAEIMGTNVDMDLICDVNDRMVSVRTNQSVRLSYAERNSIELAIKAEVEHERKQWITY